jgi:hypothetical protein
VICQKNIDITGTEKNVLHSSLDIGFSATRILKIKNNICAHNHHSVCEISIKKPP